MSVPRPVDQIFRGSRVLWSAKDKIVGLAFLIRAPETSQHFIIVFFIGPRKRLKLLWLSFLLGPQQRLKILWLYFLLDPRNGSNFYDCLSYWDPRNGLEIKILWLVPSIGTPETSAFSSVFPHIPASAKNSLSNNFSKLCQGFTTKKKEMTNFELPSAANFWAPLPCVFCGNINHISK